MESAKKGSESEEISAPSVLAALSASDSRPRLRRRRGRQRGRRARRGAAASALLSGGQQLELLHLAQRDAGLLGLAQQARLLHEAEQLLLLHPAPRARQGREDMRAAGASQGRRRARRPRRRTQRLKSGLRRRGEARRGPRRGAAARGAGLRTSSGSCRHAVHHPRAGCQFRNIVSSNPLGLC